MSALFIIMDKAGMTVEREKYSGGDAGLSPASTYEWR